MAPPGVVSTITAGKIFTQGPTLPKGKQHWLLIFKLTGKDEKLQVDLDAGQRRWLQEHTLEELQAQFKQESLKEVGQAGRTSQYRGVSAVHGKWKAAFHSRIEGKYKTVLQKVFESERDAATAYDHTVIQWNGRKAITNFIYTEDQLISIGVGTKQSGHQKGAGVKPAAKHVQQPFIPTWPNSEDASAKKSSHDEDSKQLPLPMGAAVGCTVYGAALMQPAAASTAMAEAAGVRLVGRPALPDPDASIAESAETLFEYCTVVGSHVVGVRLRLATHRLRIAEAAERAVSAAELGARVEDQLRQELAVALRKQDVLMQRYLEHQCHGDPDGV